MDFVVTLQKEEERDCSMVFHLSNLILYVGHVSSVFIMVIKCIHRFGGLIDFVFEDLIQELTQKIYQVR